MLEEAAVKEPGMLFKFHGCPHINQENLRSYTLFMECFNRWTFSPLSKDTMLAVNLQFPLFPFVSFWILGSGFLLSPFLNING